MIKDFIVMRHQEAKTNRDNVEMVEQETVKRTIKHQDIGADKNNTSMKEGGL